MCKNYKLIGFIATTGHLAMENFIFLSAFIGIYRCLLIMEAKNGILNPLDIIKIYMRKFFRIAPAYYSIWMIIWGLTSRLADGKLWNRSELFSKDCHLTWKETLFMYANLNTDDMKPLTGCY